MTFLLLKVYVGGGGGGGVRWAWVEILDSGDRYRASYEYMIDCRA